MDISHPDPLVAAKLADRLRSTKVLHRHPQSKSNQLALFSVTSSIITNPLTPTRHIGEALDTTSLGNAIPSNAVLLLNYVSFRCWTRTKQVIIDEEMETIITYLQLHLRSDSTRASFDMLTPFITLLIIIYITNHISPILYNIWIVITRSWRFSSSDFVYHLRGGD
jgi:hypothetical protein